MAGIAITVDGLGKRYRVGQRQSYRTLRESISDAFHAPLKRLRRANSAGDVDRSFWALKDVRFEVKQGEVVGVIGRNGAGKSTLLKILSRITNPTEGTVDLHGRVGSLLEVGTGFHNELSGRENIYLNGAILGMKRTEIVRVFDQIVDFAEVEDFLDTPVKRYSSGMYMRLAFAVAAHLTPEILMVDEILAVGDAKFQQKCLGKMKDASRGGRTVIFVSHDMRAIRALCDRGIVLTRGTTQGIESIDSAIAEYSQQGGSPDLARVLPLRTEDFIVTRFKLSQDGQSRDEFNGEQPIEIEIGFQTLKDLSLFRVGIFLKSPAGDVIFRSLIADWDPSLESLPAAHFVFRNRIPPGLMAAGNYTVELHCSRYGVMDYRVDEKVSYLISIRAPIDFNRVHFGERTFGMVLLDQRWTVQRELA